MSKKEISQHIRGTSAFAYFTLDLFTKSMLIFRHSSKPEADSLPNSRIYFKVVVLENINEASHL